jgi:hypothetical protein
MIADIEDRLSRAMVIDPDDAVGRQGRVRRDRHLLDEDDKKVRYQLVGQTEADAKVGRISYNSPLGRALIGRQGRGGRSVDPVGRPLLRDQEDRVHLRPGPAEMVPMVGASGAISALLGAYALLFGRNKVKVAIPASPPSSTRSGWARPGSASRS